MRKKQDLPENLFCKIDEIDSSFRIVDIFDSNILYDEVVWIKYPTVYENIRHYYCSAIFNSGDNDNLTFSFHSGDETNYTTGTFYITGVRLVDVGSSVFVNGDFEQGEGSVPYNWTTESFSGAAVFQWESGTGRNDSRCVSIEIGQDDLDDARWIQEIQLLPNTTYKMSGWIKGENIVLVQGNIGANLCLMGGWIHSPSLSGTFDWTKTEVEFETPANGIVMIGCRLGFYGSTLRGKAWFDDITITPAGPIANISGNVTYNRSDKAVSSVDIILDGISTTPTNEDGSYLFQEVLQGPHILSASKTNDHRDAISGSDAVMMLQSIAYLLTLTNEQKIAADVTLDGDVTGADAVALLRHLAFFTTHIAHTGQWSFVPPDTTFDLTADAVIDFSGYLLGDVTLDWGEIMSMEVENLTAHFDINDDDIGIHIGEPVFKFGDEVHFPLILQPGNESLQSMMATIDYDPEKLNYITTQKKQLSDNFFMVDNASEKGKIHIAMAGAETIGEAGEILTIVFKYETVQNRPNLALSRLVINDQKIESTTTGITDASSSQLPESFSLCQNFPNPFNSQTIIQYQIPEISKVNLRIFNSLGQKVMTLVESEKAPGYYKATWDGRDQFGNFISSGIYFIYFSADNFEQTKKIIFIK